MGKKTLDDCKTARDFVSYAEHHGGYVDRQSGSHVIVKSDQGGSVVIPMHNGDLKTGTRHSIIKTMVAIGLGVLLFSCVILPLLRG